MFLFRPGSENGLFSLFSIIKEEKSPFFSAQLLVFCSLGNCVVPHVVRGCCQRHFGAGGLWCSSWMVDLGEVWHRSGKGQPSSLCCWTFLWDAGCDPITWECCHHSRRSPVVARGLFCACLRLHQTHTNEFPLIPAQAAPLSAFGFFPSVSKSPALLPAPRKLWDSLQGKQPTNQPKANCSTPDTHSLYFSNLAEFSRGACGSSCRKEDFAASFKGWTQCS